MIRITRERSIWSETIEEEEKSIKKANDTRIGVGDVELKVELSVCELKVEIHGEAIGACRREAEAALPSNQHEPFLLLVAHLSLSLALEEWKRVLGFL